jgi:WD40 repeat protein
VLRPTPSSPNRSPRFASVLRCVATTGGARTSVAWRPDRRGVAASAAGGGLLWTPNGEDWKRIELAGPADGSSDVVFAADGSRFVACGADGFARRLRPRRQRDSRHRRRGSRAIFCRRLSTPTRPCSRSEVSDGIVRLHELPSGRLVRTLETMDPVDGVAFDRRARHLAVMTRGDHRTRFFAVANGAPGSAPFRRELVGREQGCSPEGDRVLVRGANGTLCSGPLVRIGGRHDGKPLVGGAAG